MKEGFQAIDKPGNAAATLDLATGALDRMADAGVEVAEALLDHRKHLTMLYATLAAMVIRNGGEVKIDKAEFITMGSESSLSVEWRGDTLVLQAVPQEATGQA